MSSDLAREGLTRAPASPLTRFQAFVYAQRNLLAALPVIIAFSTTRVSAGLAAFTAAAVLVMLGAALRAWCTLYNRFAQGEPKTLATEGPYAWLRNPIYVGNTLVLSGCALASGLPWILPVTWAWAFLVYDQVVRHEERRLLEKYGEAYQRYRQRVARWMPRFACGGPRVRFSEGEAHASASAPRTAGFLPALLVQSRALLLLLLFAAKACALAASPWA